MFTQTRGRGDRGEIRSTPGRNSSQRYPVPVKYRQLYKHTKCYACHHCRKFSDKCSDKQPKATNLVIIGVMMMQNNNGIKKTWILLDTYSTDSAKNNFDYVENVKNCAKQEELTVFMNGGSLLFNRKGRLTFFTFECEYEKLFSSRNTLFKICEQYSRSVCVNMDTSI